MPEKKVALVGNPNSGKTTLFNQLTGAAEQVGNWAGVTVDSASAKTILNNKHYEITDLPGIYTLAHVQQEGCVDEQVTINALEKPWDLVINVVDGTQLARHLYLTLQLLEQGLPVIVVINMADVLYKSGQQLYVDQLSQALGCPVVLLSAHNATGLAALREAIETYKAPPVRVRSPYPMAIESAASELTCALGAEPEIDFYKGLRLLEGDVRLLKTAPLSMPSQLRHQQDQLTQVLQMAPDIAIAKARYDYIDKLLAQSHQSGAQTPWALSAWIDRWALNRWLAIPIFITVLYCLFFVAIGIGGRLQPFFELASEALFVTGVEQLLSTWGAPQWLIAFAASGVGLGISTTVTFIPVIGTMFLCLSFLEDSGYLARAAFVVDRLMQAIGLPGKSFVPMIIGFGCNVPAVMAARTLDNQRDRILTTMMMPFMSCGARLAIYTVFVAAFFQASGAMVILGLYLLGILMAILTGLLLKKTLLIGKPSPLIMELPAYRLPRLRFLWQQTRRRTARFLKGAGSIIVPLCVVLGALNALGTDGSISLDRPHPNSVLAAVAKQVTPIFSPMGINEDNWPATVGLISGVMAKEVVVGSLNALYQEQTPSNETGSVRDGLEAALESVVSPEDNEDANHLVFGEMHERFGSDAAAMAYLIFILLYMPCISTIATMVREIGRFWAILSMSWTTVVAYSSATVFYQSACWTENPAHASLWIAAMLFLVMATIWFAQRFAPTHRRFPTPIVVTTS